jgi:hypothetical protein
MLSRTENVLCGLEPIETISSRLMYIMYPVESFSPGQKMSVYEVAGVAHHEGYVSLTLPQEKRMVKNFILLP